MEDLDPTCGFHFPKVLESAVLIEIVYCNFGAGKISYVTIIKMLIAVFIIKTSKVNLTKFLKVILGVFLKVFCVSRGLLSNFWELLFIVLERTNWVVFWLMDIFRNWQTIISSIHPSFYYLLFFINQCSKNWLNFSRLDYWENSILSL